MSEVNESLNLLQPIGTVTLPFLAKFGGISIFTDIARSQAVRLPSDLRIIDGQAIEIKYFSLLEWGVRHFAQRMGRRRTAAKIGRFKFIKHGQSVKALVRTINIATIFRQAIGDPTLVADDNLPPSGKVHTTWAHTLVNLVEWALLKEETP